MDHWFDHMDGCRHFAHQRVAQSGLPEQRAAQGVVCVAVITDIIIVDVKAKRPIHDKPHLGRGIAMPLRPKPDTRYIAARVQR